MLIVEYVLMRGKYQLKTLRSMHTWTYMIMHTWNIHRELHTHPSIELEARETNTLTRFIHTDPVAGTGHCQTTINFIIAGESSVTRSTLTGEVEWSSYRAVAAVGTGCGRTWINWKTDGMQQKSHIIHTNGGLRAGVLQFCVCILSLVCRLYYG